MEGDSGRWRCGRWVAGEMVTMLKMEDGPADGNLIAREGIFLGKGELAAETPVVQRRCRLRESHTNVEVEL
jgi:hypothetical protein